MREWLISWPVAMSNPSQWRTGYCGDGTRTLAGERGNDVVGLCVPEDGRHQFGGQQGREGGVDRKIGGPRRPHQADVVLMQNSFGVPVVQVQIALSEISPLEGLSVCGP